MGFACELACGASSKAPRFLRLASWFAVYKEGGDEEVSKPALIVVRVQAAGVDLQDVELRYAEDPQRPSCFTNRCPELRFAREAASAGVCAAEALVVDAPPKGFYVSVAGCRGPYDFEQLPRAVVHTSCVASNKAQLALGGGLFELLTKPGLPLHLARFPPLVAASTDALSRLRLLANTL